MVRYTGIQIILIIYTYLRCYQQEELENPGNSCSLKTVPYKTPVSPRLMHEPIRIRPTNVWLKARMDIPESLITENHAQLYIHALECMRKAIQSPYERVIQDRNTGGWINCEGQFVAPADQSMYMLAHSLCIPYLSYPEPGSLVLVYDLP